MENDKITMTEEEILKDYPRLKLEYTRLHEEFRHLQTKQLNILGVSNWVAVKDALPNDDNQVFVKYENGKYGINEWWQSDNCWKYNFSNMIVKEWCKPPCC